MTVVVDFSHVHRAITGIERVSLNLFSEKALEGFRTIHVRSKNKVGMVFAQWVKLPLAALFNPESAVLCPGFPPSCLLTLFFRDRVVPYIHDLFIINRVKDLNATAKYYLRPSFIMAVKKCKTFFVNSHYTQNELKKYALGDADIRLFRPAVGNIFGLVPLASAQEDILKLVCLGTVEPRKNFPYAAKIREHLERRLHQPVELHIIGRVGWGGDADLLRQDKGVVLHGFCSEQEARQVLQKADIFLSTSKEEGLGLPLLEVQHGGLLVAAVDIPVFREVLGESGCLLPVDDAEKAVDMLVAVLEQQGWKEKYRRLSLENIEAWNKAAREDRKNFLNWLGNKVAD